MRAFLAIELPGAIRGALGDVQRGLAGQITGWRWSRPEGIHLTLRFLGEVAPEALERATPPWRVAASAVAPFTIRVAGLGVFPSVRRPRVLWAGVTEEPPAGHLEALADRIEAASEAASLGRADRRFVPHLTLARASNAAGGVPSRRDALDCGVAPVVEVVLFRSELRSQGAVHTPLDRFPLGGGRA